MLPTGMIARIKKLLFDPDAAGDIAETPGSGDQDVVAALLIQAALVDGHFSDDERGVIAEILIRDHAAKADEAARLMDEAEAQVRESVQIFGLTSAVNDRFDHDAKIALMENLWQVMISDGIIDKFESNLMRRLAGLLHVSDRDIGEARQRVIARADGGGTD